MKQHQNRPPRRRGVSIDARVKPGPAPGFGPSAGFDAAQEIELARRLMRGGRIETARAKLDEIIDRRPKLKLAYRMRSRLFAADPNDSSRARADLEQALTLDPRDSETLKQLANLCFRAGDDAAALRYARDCLAINPARGEPYQVLVKLLGPELDDTTFAALEALAQRGDPEGRLEPADRQLTLNALARAYQSRGRYDDAFPYFMRAAALSGGRHEQRYFSDSTASIDARLTPEFFEQRRGWGVGDGRSLFIIGMPRSGSTLLEQALTAHPKIDSVGESAAATVAEQMLVERFGRAAVGGGHLFSFLERLDKGDARLTADRYLSLVSGRIAKKAPRRVVDKALVNFVRVPLLRLMLPKATILHSFRHPLDTCLSCLQQTFTDGAYARSQESIAAYYADYARLMDQWERTLGPGVEHVCHEDLARGFEPGARALVAMAGVPWNDACAEPHKNQRLVDTSSAGQVRRPVNTEAVGRWRRYERHLRPLIDRLGGHAAIDARYERFRTLAARKTT